MRKLKPTVKTYDWGMPAVESGASLFTHDDGVQYDRISELWWGHPSTTILETLEEVEVPFLLKLLFVGAPLSLQAHPTQEQLATYPGFPDNLPKPEIIVATTAFEALCGFCSAEKIIEKISNIHPLYPYKDFKSLFMVADIDRLVQLVYEYALMFATEAPCRIFLSLYDIYPSGDPAVLCPFYMNHVCLDEGQALVIPASQPHCYLSGCGVECMPASDNVVRCGLTTKECDIPLFFSITASAPRDAIVCEYPYGHPELDPVFLLRRPDDAGVCGCSDKSVVLVLEGEGTINENSTTKGDSWIVDGDGSVSFSSGMDVLIAIPQ